MTRTHQPDHFTVINGPEDGTEFPIVRPPATIGSDPRCAVNLRLDAAVEPTHARVTLASEGYRIRRVDVGKVFVDGKRAGVVRSRIVRDGGCVQVGNTLLVLNCACDGRAQRSRGIPAGSDLVWAVRHGADKILTAFAWVVRFVIRLFRQLLSGWTPVIVVFALLCLFWAPFHYFVRYRVIEGWVAPVLRWLRTLLQ